MPSTQKALVDAVSTLGDVVCRECGKPLIEASEGFGDHAYVTLIRSPEPAELCVEQTVARAIQCPLDHDGQSSSADLKTIRGP